MMDTADRAGKEWLVQKVRLGHLEWRNKSLVDRPELSCKVVGHVAHWAVEASLVGWTVAVVKVPGHGSP